MMDWSGARVLITGAGGFIAANLAEELLRQGAEVHGLIRPQTDLWRIRHITSKMTLHKVDLLRASSLRKLLLEVRPDYVFHLATRRGENTARERRKTFGSNVLGLFNLLEAAGASDCRGLVNMGSSLEYAPKATAHKETDHTTPALLYSLSKTAATLIAEHYARTRGQLVVTLRIFSAFGYWEAKHRLIPTAIRAAFDDGELLLTAPGFRHDLVFVEDVVGACLLAARAASISGQVLNIGSGREWTNEQVVAVIERLTGRTIRKRIGAFLPRPQDTAHWLADIQSAAAQLGWRPKHTLEEGLRKTIDWLEAHQYVYKRRREQRAQ